MIETAKIDADIHALMGMILNGSLLCYHYTPFIEPILGAGEIHSAAYYPSEGWEGRPVDRITYFTSAQHFTAYASLGHKIPPPFPEISNHHGIFTAADYLAKCDLPLYRIGVKYNAVPWFTEWGPLKSYSPDELAEFHFCADKPIPASAWSVVQKLAATNRWIDIDFQRGLILSR